VTDPKCPMCKSTVSPRSENKAFPFCSKRCQQIDLGQWLGGEYVIASPSYIFDLPLPTDPEDD